MKTNVVRARIAQINGIGDARLISEAFTKQHYIAIANIIKASEDKNEIAMQLAGLFAKDNSAFNRSLFMKACGF